MIGIEFENRLSSQYPLNWELLSGIEVGIQREFDLGAPQFRTGNPRMNIAPVGHDRGIYGVAK